MARQHGCCRRLHCQRFLLRGKEIYQLLLLRRIVTRHVYVAAAAALSLSTPSRRQYRYHATGHLS